MAISQAPVPDFAEPPVDVARQLPEFRERLEQLLHAPVNRQAVLRRDLAASIQSSPVPVFLLHEVVRQGCLRGGPHSFDIAIDLLSGFDAPLLEVFRSFVSKDKPRWDRHLTAGHINDDVGYVLLRSLARSKVPLPAKLDAIKDCLHLGTSSLREAAAIALGDLGGDDAKNLLRQVIANDADSLVRDSAKEALDDLGE